VLRPGGVSPAATGPNPYDTSFCDEHSKNSADAGAEQPKAPQTAWRGNWRRLTARNGDCPAGRAGVIAADRAPASGGLG
jgi:hypothetical protein